MNRAAGALKQARDQVLLAFGSTMAAASVTLLLENANALVEELVQQFCALARSDDPEVTAWVAMLLDRLHTAAQARQAQAREATEEKTS